MCTRKRILPFVIIVIGLVVPVCIGQTDKVLSGRELLKAMRKTKAGEPAPPASAEKSQPTANELLGKFVETQDNLQSFVVKIESRTEERADLTGKPRQEFNKKMVSEYRSDGNRFHHHFHSSKDNLHSYTSHLWQGDTWYDTARGGEDPGRLIISKRRDPIKDKQRFSRGRAIGPWLGYFYGDDERIDTILQEAIDQGGHISVREKIKDTGGSHYSVIAVETKRGKYTVWLDPDKDYNIVKAIVDKRSGDSFYDQPPMKDGEYSYYKLDHIQYKKEDSIWIPQKARWHIKRKALQGYFESTTECIFTEVTLDPDHEVLGSFVLDDVIDGAKVYIRGVPNITYTWRDGNLIPDVDEAAIDQLDKMADEIIADAKRALRDTTVSDLLTKYRENQDKIKSFITKGKTSIERNAGKKTEERCEFRSDGNRVSLRYFSWDGVATTKDKAGYKSFLWNGTSLVEYDKATESIKGKAGVTKDKNRIEEKLAVDYRGAALLGILFGDYERVDLILGRARQISLREKREKIGDAQCFVIEAATERGDYIIWIDPDHGFNIAKASVKRSSGDLIQRAARIERSMSFLLENVRFEQIDDVWVPMEADMKRTVNNKEVARVHHLRTEFVLNPDTKILGSFVADDIPDGTAVTVAGDSGKYIWKDGRHVMEGGGNVGR